MEVHAEKQGKGHLQMTWLSKVASGNKVRRLLLPEPPGEPNPRCVICGTCQLQLHINTEATTLATFIDKVRARFESEEAHSVYSPQRQWTLSSWMIVAGDLAFYRLS